MRTSKLVLALFSIAVGALVTGPANSRGLHALSQRPADTIEAENRRVWLAQERKAPCQMTVEIVDSAGTKVRHFFDDLLYKGYYNLYWDKLDDSGRFVPEDLRRSLLQVPLHRLTAAETTALDSDQ